MQPLIYYTVHTKENPHRYLNIHALNNSSLQKAILYPEWNNDFIFTEEIAREKADIYHAYVKLNNLDWPELVVSRIEYKFVSAQEKALVGPNYVYYSKEINRKLNAFRTSKGCYVSPYASDCEIQKALKPFKFLGNRYYLLIANNDFSFDLKQLPFKSQREYICSSYCIQACVNKKQLMTFMLNDSGMRYVAINLSTFEPEYDNYDN